MNVSTKVSDINFEFSEWQLQVLRFFLYDSEGGEYLFGINTEKVEIITEVSAFTKLAKSNEPFIGLMRYQNIPVPILDLSLLMSQKPSEQVGRFPPRIIICNMLNKFIGLLVPRTLPTIRIANSAILAPPQEIQISSKVLVNGIYDHDDSYLMMLDLEGIISDLIGEETVVSEIERCLEGKQVLIAEDSRAAQKQLEMIFEKMGAKIKLVENGQLALQELNTTHYDLLVTDIEMPMVNGIQLARQVKANPKLESIPIIFHSSISNQVLIDAIKSENLGSYIIKFEPEKIQSEVKSIFRKSSGFEIW